jgi:hypothetical protein
MGVPAAIPLLEILRVTAAFVQDFPLIAPTIVLALIIAAGPEQLSQDLWMILIAVTVAHLLMYGPRTRTVLALILLAWAGVALAGRLLITDATYAGSRVIEWLRGQFTGRTRPP